MDIDAVRRDCERNFDECSKGNSVVPPVGYLAFPEGKCHIKYGYIKGDPVLSSILRHSVSIMAKPILRPGSRWLRDVGRFTVVVVGILGLATALFFQNVYRLMVKSYSILMVSLFVPMTAAAYWKKANETALVSWDFHVRPVSWRSDKK